MSEAGFEWMGGCGNIYVQCDMKSFSLLAVQISAVELYKPFHACKWFACGENCGENCGDNSTGTCKIAIQLEVLIPLVGQ